LIGRLSSTPPSTKYILLIITGLNKTGILEDAMTAVISSPFEI
jgi:hypothetical protein